MGVKPSFHFYSERNLNSSDDLQREYGSFRTKKDWKIWTHNWVAGKTNPLKCAVMHRSEISVHCNSNGFRNYFWNKFHLNLCIEHLHPFRKQTNKQQQQTYSLFKHVRYEWFYCADNSAWNQDTCFYSVTQISVDVKYSSNNNNIRKKEWTQLEKHQLKFVMNQINKCLLS